MKEEEPQRFATESVTDGAISLSAGRLADSAHSD